MNREGTQEYTGGDDKMHHEVSSASVKTSGLRQTKHTQDNRWGYNLHTLVCPATIIPVNIKYENGGEATEDTVKAMIAGSSFSN